MKTDRESGTDIFSTEMSKTNALLYRNRVRTNSFVSMLKDEFGSELNVTERFPDIGNRDWHNFAVDFCDGRRLTVTVNECTTAPELLFCVDMMQNVLYSSPTRLIFFEVYDFNYDEVVPAFVEYLKSKGSLDKISKTLTESVKRHGSKLDSYLLCYKRYIAKRRH